MDASASTPWPDRLRQERIQRNWRQQDLADQLGTTVITIHRWERGHQQPSAYFRLKLCTLFGKSAQELGLLEEKVPSPSTSARETLEEEHSSSSSTDERVLWSVPYTRNPYFTGREMLLHQLHEQLHPKHYVALTQPHILSGLGGIGKTQTALEYVYRFRHEYRAVLWIDAETRESMLSGYLALAQLFQLPEKDHVDQAMIQEAVTRWFQNHTRWLLVFDNVEHLEMLYPFLPDPSQGQILITTRSQMIGTMGFHLDLQNMDLAEGALFLLRRARLLHPQASFDAAPAALRAQAEALVSLLDGLPLALDQAGAYIEETKCTLAAYHEHYLTYRLKLLSQRGVIRTHHPTSVTTTFSLAFYQVEQASPVAADLLRVCAFLYAEAIPEQVFPQAGETLGPTLQALSTDSLGLDAAIRELRRFSLLSREPATRTFTIHRLLQAIIQDEMDEEERKQWRGRLLLMLNRVFPVRDSSAWIQMENWPWCEQLVPHVAWVTTPLEREDHPLEVAALVSKVAFYFQDRARFQEAAIYHQRAVDIWEHELGPHHLLLIEPLIGLADALRFLRKEDQAMSYARRAITLIESTLGADLFPLMTPLTIVATIHCEHGQLQEAERLLLRALSIWVRTVQAEEVVAPSFSCVWEQDAMKPLTEPLLEQALALWAHNPHHRHHAIGRSITLLSHVYQKQQRYTEAEALLLLALPLGKEALGMTHHHLATPLSILAHVYQEQGRLVEARQYYSQALRISEEGLGPQHSLTREIRRASTAIL